MKLNITGYSTALFSTWYFIEELGLLFDAGDGLTSALLQKSRKIENVFISHADRDHLTGLLQFNQLNAREGFPRIFFPFDCGSFPAIEQFSKKFDPHVSGTTWTAIKQNEQIQVRDNIYVQALRNSHVRSEQDVFKSFGYRVVHTKTRLKPEFAQVPQQKIKSLIDEIGKELLTEVVKTNLLTYSGDTPVDDFAQWNDTEVLIHEATFLKKEENKNLDASRNRHSNLEEIIALVSNLNIGKLILGHFSSRYSGEQIDEAIRTLCKRYLIKIPVYRVLPGQVHKDILNEDPLNA